MGTSLRSRNRHVPRQHPRLYSEIVVVDRHSARLINEDRPKNRHHQQYSTDLLTNHPVFISFQGIRNVPSMVHSSVSHFTVSPGQIHAALASEPGIRHTEHPSDHSVHRGRLHKHCGFPYGRFCPWERSSVVPDVLRMCSA
jgi:hypothetical protein